MKRTIAIIAAGLAVLALAACSSDQALLKAQADAAVADGNARVAEAQARAEEARAVIALAPKIDAGGASAYLIAKAVGGVQAPRTQPVTIQRPRDWLDYLQGVTGVVSALGNIAVPIVTVKENGRTQRELYARDVSIEQARQSGETWRIATVAQIASDVAAGRPNTTINVGRDATLGGSQANDNSATDRHDAHTCNGGAGAPGGAGGGGGAATGAGGDGATSTAGPGGTC